MNGKYTSFWFALWVTTALLGGYYLGNKMSFIAGYNAGHEWAMQQALVLEDSRRLSQERINKAMRDMHACRWAEMMAEQIECRKEKASR